MDLRLLSLDARNRALRTFLVNALIDALTAVGLTIDEVLDTSGGDVDWRIMAVMVGKTVIASVGSFLLRRFGDPSNVWTPLPPTPQPQPADPANPNDTF